MLDLMPVEVLERIAFHLFLSNPIGLPKPSEGLSPLLCTCHYIHDAVINNPKLYSDIFHAKFDTAAAVRRFGAKALYTSTLQHQLKTYFSVMRFLRAGDIWASNTEGMLWFALFAMTEDDGKNRAQMLWAGLDTFVENIVRQRLYQGSSNGWPQDSPLSSLALWLMWMTTTKDKINAESPQERQSLIELLLPFVAMSCRYPSAYVPSNHFIIPFTSSTSSHYPDTRDTVHGPYPLYRDDKCHSFDGHFGSMHGITVPLHTTAARLIFFSRRSNSFPVPPEIPETRSHAISLGYTGVCLTQEDVHEFNAHRPAQLPIETSFDEPSNESANWDEDWNRWVYCWDPWMDMPLKGPVYKPGSLTGLWHGRALVGLEGAYVRLMSTRMRPMPFTERNMDLTVMPIYVRIREHHCVSPAPMVDVGGRNDGFDDGLLNAWLPRMSMRERDGRLRFLNADKTERAEVYTTLRPGESLTGEHDPKTCEFCEVRRRRDERIRGHVRKRQAMHEMMLASGGLDTTILLPMDAKNRQSPCYPAHLVHPVDDSPAVASSRPSSSSSPPLYEHHTNRPVEKNDWEHTVDICSSSEEDSDNDERKAYESEPDVTSYDEFSDFPCDGIRDIALTGETDHRHGLAWHSYQFFGRVRLYDGLISLLRIPVPTPTYGADGQVTGYAVAGLGRWVFTGYLTGGKNLVGTWRTTRRPPEEPAWEMPFVVAKCTS